MITFINPRSSFLEKDAMMPPLGLFYLVAKLKSEGIDATVNDLALNDMSPLGPTYITGTSAQPDEIMMCANRNQYTVVGGPHASMNPNELIKHFDCVVVGEGEEVIAEIVKNKPTGIIKTKRIKNLDSLPFPDRTQAHRYNWTINGKKATTMMTSRGCTGRCSFCCKPLRKGIFFRSAQNVIDECIHIKALGFGAIMFYDDSMLMNKQRMIDICRGIRRLGLSWRCFARSDQMDYQVAKKMAEAGCYEILIGVESGSQKILDNIRKDETPEQHINAFRLAKLVGIKTKALMIAGLPGETPDTVEESRQFIIKTKPDSLDVTILSVYNGCDIQKNPSKYDITFSNPTWYKGKQNEYISTVQTSAMTAEDIVKARNILYKTFLLNR